MCRSVHVLLTESERKTATRMWGVMIPVYASIALVVLATLILNPGSRNGEQVAAVDAAPAASLGNAVAR